MMARNGLAHTEPYLWNNRYMMFNGKMLQSIIWEEHNGTIPEGYFVHHRNGNKLDNRIENFELTTRPEHCRLHKPRVGYRAPVFTHCKVCGGQRSLRAMLSEPHRHLCYKCKAKQNRERRKALACI